MPEKKNINKLSGKHFQFDNLFLEHPLKCGFIDLYQIGELCCESNFVINEHKQWLCEITYVISGEGTAYTDNKATRLYPGVVMVNSPGHLHKIVTAGNSLLRFAYMGFMLNKGADKEKYRPLREFYMNEPFYARKAANDILNPFMKLVNEFYSHGAYSDKLITSYCEQLIMLTARNFSDSIPLTPDRKVNLGVGAAVYSAVRYIDNNIENIESISSIAKHLGYSDTYLSHTFKRKTGVTLQEYIRYKKIDYAAQLLRDGEMTPSQLTELLNYDSLSSFSRSFKKVMGVSPRQYAEKYNRQIKPTQN